MMRLTDLEPRFLRNRLDASGVSDYVDTLAEANGVCFVCPQCLKDAGMVRPGVHSVLCWSPGVPLTIQPGPGRWAMRGTSAADLSLVAHSSSVKITGGAHFTVTDGAIQFHGDSRRCA